MAALIILGLLFFATAVVLLVRALALPRMHTSTQLQQIRSYGFNADVVVQADETRSSLAEDFEAFAAGVGRFTESIIPSLKPFRQSQLASAGVRRLSPDAVHGYRVLFTLAVTLFLLAEGIAATTFSALTALLVVVGGLAAWVLPATVLRRRAQSRLDRIDRALPELIDVLTATIEAGLGFGGSLQLVADRFEGPLGEELRLTLHEQNMGLSTEDALSNMLHRCDTASMRTFVRAVLQGQALGVSVGQMMRAVATDTRSRRRQAAREKVQKAPVKLLFPLVFMIFPSLLLVILYPAFHSLTVGLGGG